MDGSVRLLLHRMSLESSTATVIESPGKGRSRPFRELVREVHDAHYASIFRYLDRLSGDPDLAAEGQGFRDGAEIVIAETDEALVRSIIALCSDPEQFENQRQLARETVLRRYGQSTVVQAVGQGLGLADVSDRE